MAAASATNTGTPPADLAPSNGPAPKYGPGSLSASSYSTNIELPPEAEMVIPSILSDLSPTARGSTPRPDPWAGLSAPARLSKRLKHCGAAYIWPGIWRYAEPYLHSLATKPHLSPLAMDVIDKIADCASLGAVMIRQGKWEVAPHFCRQRLCPVCQRGRHVAMRKSVSDRITRAKLTPKNLHANRKWYLITLTVRNCEPADLSDTLDRLAERWHAFRRRHNLKGLWIAGFYAFEITYNPDTNTFHPHIHALVCGEWCSRKRLVNEWSECWGGFANGHISTVHASNGSMTAALEEVLKYLTKWQSESLHCAFPLNEYIAAVFNRRMFGTFGKIYGSKIDEDIDEGPKNASAVVTKPGDAQNPHVVCHWGDITMAAVRGNQQAMDFLLLVRKHRSRAGPD